MLINLRRYIATARFLTAKQLCYQVYYPLRSQIRKLTGHAYNLQLPAQSVPLKIQQTPFHETSVYFFENEIKFLFLNKEKIFLKNNIDWSYFGGGRLWNYNMHYFDFLSQENITREEGIFLIQDSINKLPETPTALEPYPISLRTLNWIKFFAKHNIQDSGFDASLYAQYKILQNNLEYHLLHNHLLANAFSLCAGGLYFSDEVMFLKGKKILQQQLKKQILSDGAHFERSPMYHQLMLEHLLDVINVIQNNKATEQSTFLHFLLSKAEKMLGWLTACTFNNGDIPFVNDSAEYFAYTTAQLKTYSQQLGLFPQHLQLSESGYRLWRVGAFELFFDTGELAASYQAGHAHADTFTFLLHISGKRFIIDTGVSTYEKCARREFERSTRAHNTVTYNNENSSDVWHVFRTAKRAHVKTLQEEECSIVATHDGYRKYNVTHERKFAVQKNKISITDSLIGNVKYKSLSYFYFHEDANVKLSENSIISDSAEIFFENAELVELLDCEIAHGFNKLVHSKVCRCTFQKHMITTIQILI